MTGDANSKEISWYAPNGEKLSSNQHISVGRTGDSESTLTIYNVNIEDAGIYRCVVSSEEGELEATLNVKIFRKAPVLFPFQGLTWGICTDKREAFSLACLGDDNMGRGSTY